MDALIGYSGFVGSFLRRQHSFDALFNSSNINEVGALKFDTVFCSAAPGSMFIAAKAHSDAHYHMNYVVWYLPFVPFSAMLATKVLLDKTSFLKIIEGRLSGLRD